MTPQTAFLQAAAALAGIQIPRERFCLKCRKWKPEDGCGAGRQYRCAVCAAGRRAALMARKAGA